MSVPRGLRWITLATAGVLLAGCAAPSPPDHAGSPPELATLVVQAQVAPRAQTWDGVVEAVQQVTITAQTNARVTALPYDVGDKVGKGAVLARFSAVEQQSARDSAQAQVASAQAAYRDAQASFERIATVYGQGYVSTAQMDQQRAARDAAKAALQAAQAQAQAAGQQLDYTVLRAPFAGVLTQRYVHVGQAVQSGPPSPQPLLQLQALDALRVTVQVPQGAAAAIRRDPVAEVAVGDMRFAAGRVEVLPYADPLTHSVTVRVALPADLGGLYPGVTAKVTFAGGEATRLLVPLTSVVERGELVAVYVVGADAVTLRQVRLGQREGGQVEVLAGLGAGERVASDPAAAMNWLVKRHAAGASGHG